MEDQASSTGVASSVFGIETPRLGAVQFTKASQTQSSAPSKCSLCDDEELVRRMYHQTSASLMAKPELPLPRGREPKKERRLLRHTSEPMNKDIPRHTVRIHSAAVPTPKKHTKASQTVPVITRRGLLSARDFGKTSYSPTNDERRTPKSTPKLIYRARSDPVKFPLHDKEPALRLSTEPLTKKKLPRHTITVHRPAVPTTAKRHHETVEQDALCSDAVDCVLSTKNNNLTGLYCSQLGYLNSGALARSSLNRPSQRHFLRSAANTIMGLIIVVLKLAFSVARVPAKVVVAVFSREPPWCSSSPKTSDCCIQPSYSTESMWAVDALFFDSSV